MHGAITVKPASFILFFLQYMGVIKHPCAWSNKNTHWELNLHTTYKHPEGCLLDRVKILRCESWLTLIRIS